MHLLYRNPPLLSVNIAFYAIEQTRLNSGIFYPFHMTKPILIMFLRLVFCIIQFFHVYDRTFSNAITR